MIKIYGWFTSPYTIRVLIYAKFMKMPFEYIPTSTIPFIKALNLYFHYGFVGFYKSLLPVLVKENSESIDDSISIGKWMCNSSGRVELLESDKTVDEIHTWINKRLLPTFSRFTMEYHKETSLELERRNAVMRIYDVMSKTNVELRIIAPLIRKFWPHIIVLYGYSPLTHLTRDIDRSDFLPQKRKVIEEFVEKLNANEGDYFGGKEPNLADLTAYSIMIYHKLIGLNVNVFSSSHFQINNWMDKMSGKIELPLI